VAGAKFRRQIPRWFCRERGSRWRAQQASCTREGKEFGRRATL